MGADSDAYYFCGCLDGSRTLDSREGQQSGVGPEGVMGEPVKHMLRLNTDTEFYWIGETSRTVRSLCEYTGRVASPESTLPLPLPFPPLSYRKGMC